MVNTRTTIVVETRHNRHCYLCCSSINERSYGGYGAKSYKTKHQQLSIKITSKVKEVVNQQQLMVDMVQNLTRWNWFNGLIPSLSFHGTSLVELLKSLGDNLEKIIYPTHNYFPPKFLHSWLIYAKKCCWSSNGGTKSKKSCKIANHVFDEMSVADFLLCTKSV